MDMRAHPCFINCMTKEKWGLLQKQMLRRINVMPRISEPPEWREPNEGVNQKEFRPCSH